MAALPEIIGPRLSNFMASAAIIKTGLKKTKSALPITISLIRLITARLRSRGAPDTYAAGEWASCTRLSVSGSNPSKSSKRITRCGRARRRSINAFTRVRASTRWSQQCGPSQAADPNSLSHRYARSGTPHRSRYACQTVIKNSNNIDIARDLIAFD